MTTPTTSAERLFAVLRAFDKRSPAMTLAEITRRVGLSHSTTRRLVLALVEVGALEKRADGRFVIGIGLWELGTLSPRSISLRDAAAPFLEDLHGALKQHVQIGVLKDKEVVLIERVSAPGAGTLASRVGGRLPLHASGVGKVFLAYSEPSLLQTVLADGLERLTPHTLVSEKTLRRDLADTRRRGFALVREETTLGADSVAVPVFDRGRHLVAALSAVVAAGTQDLYAIAPALLAASRGITRRLGG